MLVPIARNGIIIILFDVDGVYTAIDRALKADHPPGGVWCAVRGVWCLVRPTSGSASKKYPTSLLLTVPAGSPADNPAAEGPVVVLSSCL